MQIIIKSNGQKIGTLSPNAFRSGVNAPIQMFLPEVIAKWNAFKTSIGEPERAEISIRGNA